MLDSFRIIDPKTTESDNTGSASVSGSDCEPKAVSSAVPLHYDNLFNVLSHSEPTSPFVLQSLFSDTDSDATHHATEHSISLLFTENLLSKTYSSGENLMESFSEV